MSAPQTLIQAAFNRLTARLGSGLADAAAELALLAQDTPQRLRQEWDLFVEEVELEARRLEDPSAPPPATAATAASASSAPAPPPSQNPQEQIDALRATVARLARRLEDQL